MQMQKKITVKEDGRFLVYYHFPDTATPEETQAFEAVQEVKESEKRRGGEGEAENASDSSLLNPHYSLTPEGSAHV